MFATFLADVLCLFALLSLGATGGWLACSIIVSGKMRRLQIDSWRAAKIYYTHREESTKH